MTLYVFALFCIGCYGLFHPKNILSFLMSIEIIILSSATQLIERIAMGQVSLESGLWILLMLIVAGSELAIGLALVMRAFKDHHSLCVESFNQLKG